MAPQILVQGLMVSCSLSFGHISRCANVLPKTAWPIYRGCDLTCTAQTVTYLLCHWQGTVVQNKSPGQCTSQARQLSTPEWADVFPHLPKYFQVTSDLKHKNQWVVKNGGLESTQPGSKFWLHWLAWSQHKPLTQGSFYGGVLYLTT